MKKVFGVIGTVNKPWLLLQENSCLLEKISFPGISETASNVDNRIKPGTNH